MVLANILSLSVQIFLIIDIFSKNPAQGDLVVFKTPIDNRTDYIKRLIGLPGDEIQFKNGELLINGNIIKRELINISEPIWCGDYKLDTNTFIETLPNGKKHLTTYNKAGSLQNTKNIKCLQITIS